MAHVYWLKCTDVSEELTASINKASMFLFTVTINAAACTETSVHFYQFRRRHHLTLIFRLMGV